MLDPHEQADARRSFMRDIHDVHFSTRLTKSRMLDFQSGQTIPSAIKCLAMTIKFTKVLPVRRKLDIAESFTQLLDDHHITPVVPLIDELGDPICFNPIEHHARLKGGDIPVVGGNDEHDPCYSQLVAKLPTHKTSAALLIQRSLVRNEIEITEAAKGVDRALADLLKRIKRGDDGFNLVA
jgi:hypothetical protein